MLPLDPLLIKLLERVSLIRHEQICYKVAMINSEHGTVLLVPYSDDDGNDAVSFERLKQSSKTVSIKELIENEETTIIADSYRVAEMVAFE